MAKQLIVIGGGAAGIFCAVNAARREPGLRVTVLEKTGKLLSKVKVSGGGRCNVTHACFDIAEMAAHYPRGQHFVRKAFHRFFTTDTIEWFASRGVELKTEADGRMFPITDSSQTIIDCLMREVNACGVEIRMHAEVRDVVIRPGGDAAAAGGAARPAEGRGAGELAGAGRDAVGELARARQAAGDAGNRFEVLLADGRRLPADFVCVACGGFPKLSMFDWIQRLGHTIEEPVPSLFTFNVRGNPLTSLMGISVPEAQVKIQGTRLAEEGPLLITHWGLSGPVVLRLSAWGARELAATGYRFGVQVNWLGEVAEQQARERLQEMRQERAAQGIAARNPFGLPQRLWEHFLTTAGVGWGVRWAELPAREANRLVSLLCAGAFSVEGKTTFKEEFVTAGGVRLAEVDPASFQSRKVPGLFFAGEILDVDGITGGFNFQHAWTGGWIAAETIASQAKSD